MKCETCDQDHNGLYGSGRFCSKRCARSFSTQMSREEINKRVSQKLLGRQRIITKGDKRLLPHPTIIVTEEDLRREVPLSRSWRDLCIRLIGSTSIVKRLPREVMKYNGIDTSHFHKKLSPCDILKKRPGERKGHLRETLIKIGRSYTCSSCGILPVWNGRDLTLQVDHIDGDNSNHEASNLRFLCPNCHSQTDTFSWRNVYRKRLVTRGT